MVLANLFAIVLKATEVEGVNSTLTNASLILASMEALAVTPSTTTLVHAPKVTAAVIASSMLTIVPRHHVAMEVHALIWSMTINAYATYHTLVVTATRNWIHAHPTSAATEPNVRHPQTT